MWKIERVLTNGKVNPMLTKVYLNGQRLTGVMAYSIGTETIPDAGGKLFAGEVLKLTLVPDSIEIQEVEMSVKESKLSPSPSPEDRVFATETLIKGLAEEVKSKFED